MLGFFAFVVEDWFTDYPKEETCQYRYYTN